MSRLSVYTTLGSQTRTPQVLPIPGREMVRNDAGGFAFELNHWKMLDRFLVLGTDSNGYYASAQKLTFTNYENVKKCLAENPIKVVDRLVHVSRNGLALKNEPALFVLALASAHTDEHVRQYALSKLNLVARTGTHLFHFVEFVTKHRKWGRALKNAVANWFLTKSPDVLGLQMVKYKSRDGWSMKDLIKLSHPKGDAVYSEMFAWALGKDAQLMHLPHVILASDDVLANWQGVSPARVAQYVGDYKLPWEGLPTELLRNKQVWEALLPHIGLEGVVRNLGRLTNIGLFDNGPALATVVSRLTDADAVKKSRIHPLRVLIATRTYARGAGLKGSLTWSPNAKILKALDRAFELSFASIEMVNAKVLVALDASGSMWGRELGDSGLTSAEATAAIAKVLTAQFSHVDVVRYTGDVHGSFDVEGRRLDDVLQDYRRQSVGQLTDCASPVVWATNSRKKYDLILNTTDSMSYAGDRHCAQAVAEYKNRVNKDVKVIYLVTEATSTSLADPKDPNQLDIAGFSSDIPTVVARFQLGEI